MIVIAIVIVIVIVILIAMKVRPRVHRRAAEGLDRQLGRRGDDPQGPDYIRLYDIMLLLLLALLIVLLCR